MVLSTYPKCHLIKCGFSKQYTFSPNVYLNCWCTFKNQINVSCLFCWASGSLIPWKVSSITLDSWWLDWRILSNPVPSILFTIGNGFLPWCKTHLRREKLNFFNNKKILCSELDCYETKLWGYWVEHQYWTPLISNKWACHKFSKKDALVSKPPWFPNKWVGSYKTHGIHKKPIGFQEKSIT